MRIKGNNICEVPCILPYPQPTSAPHTPTISYEKSKIPGEFTQSVGMSGEGREMESPLQQAHACPLSLLPDC